MSFEWLHFAPIGSASIKKSNVFSIVVVEKIFEGTNGNLCGIHLLSKTNAIKIWICKNMRVKIPTLQPCSPNIWEACVDKSRI